MVDTLPSVAISSYIDDNDYSMRHKGQLLVVLSRIKLDKDTIFFGNKESALNELVNLLKNVRN